MGLTQFHLVVKNCQSIFSFVQTIIKVGFDIIDYKFLAVAKSVPRRELTVMTVVFLLTVFYDLIFAVAVGIVLASILFAASVSDSTNVSAVNLEQIDDVNEDIFDDERD